MPPQLALLIGITVILYCLREYGKNQGKVEKLFWVFTIWFMIIGSRTLYEWIYGTSGTLEGTTSGTESNPMNLIFGIGFAVFGLYALIKKQFNFSLAIQKNIPLVLLLLYCLMSCLWSPDPGTSFRRWIRMILLIIVVVAIVNEKDRVKTIQTLFNRYASFAIPLSIVFIKYFGDLGTLWNQAGTGLMWTGVCTHKNMLGTMLAASILYFVWKWVILKDLTKIKVDVFLFAIASYIMFNPQVKGSSTAILSFLASLIFLFCIKFFQKRLQVFTTVFYAIIFSYFITDTLLKMFTHKTILEYVTLASGRDMTFTGRTYVWDAVMEEAKNSPIIGTGYGMFWTGSRLIRLHAHYLVDDIYQSHNGYIETYANLGMVGLILLIITLFIALNYHIKAIQFDYKYHSLAVVVLTQCILAEFFEAAVLSPSSPRWVILLLFLIRTPDNYCVNEINETSKVIAV